MSRQLLSFTLALILGAACTSASQELPPPDPQQLAALWDRERLPLPPPPLVTHEMVEAQVARLVRESNGLITSEVLGHSVEGRAIHHLTVGRGKRVVLLWSQMHGDEPTATSALFDLCQWMVTHRNEPVVTRLLDNLTLHMVPMLNPDGATRFTRRNAQGIDINRDALHLSTPEGTLLKALRDRVKPEIGFNLHNQSWRTSVGRPPQPAAISLLAVAYDEARTVDARRLLTKRTSAVIAEALQPFAAGRIGRYDDEFEVRAFGDNITLWGTGVVLIETGPWPGPEPDRMLVRLNFVALVSALDALATDRVAGADPGVYDALPENEGRLLHTIVQGGTLIAGTGVKPYRADVGIGGTRVVRQTQAGREMRWQASVQDIGDLRVYGALETVDASGLYVSAVLDPAAKVGDEVAVPVQAPASSSTNARDSARVVLGAAPRLWLLRPAGTADRYTIVRIIDVR